MLLVLSLYSRGRHSEESRVSCPVDVISALQKGLKPVKSINLAARSMRACAGVYWSVWVKAFAVCE